MRAWALFAALACASCAKHEVTVEIFDLDLTSSDASALQTIADATAREVRPLLPALPPELVLRVRAADKVIAETGETGTALPPNTIYWSVDPKHAGGVRAIIDHQLRATLFHELHHLVRDNVFERSTILDAAITEGLATAFERDYARAPVPWGEYPAGVDAWAAELIALPDSAPREPWMFRHPDGRRWIAYKVGTYLVDRAVKASGRTPAQLVLTPAKEILRLSE